MTEPNYSPLMSYRLAFPPDWIGIHIWLRPTGAEWDGWKTEHMFSYFNILSETTVDGRVFTFKSWEELQNCLKGPQRGNRQLHIIADLISWHLIELPF